MRTTTRQIAIVVGAVTPIVDSTQSPMISSKLMLKSMGLSRDARETQNFVGLHPARTVATAFSSSVTMAGVFGLIHLANRGQSMHACMQQDNTAIWSKIPLYGVETSSSIFIGLVACVEFEDRDFPRYTILNINGNEKIVSHATWPYEEHPSTAAGSMIKYELCSNGSIGAKLFHSLHATKLRNDK